MLSVHYLFDIEISIRLNGIAARMKTMAETAAPI